MSSRNARTEIEALFPRLHGTGYIITSDYEATYNCVAFVAGDRKRRWEPEARGGWYWPPELPLEDFSLQNYLRCFGVLGFESCADGSLEQGVEKIAVFVDAEGDFSHVARQLDDGWWSSKLGGYEDLSHPAVEDLFRGRPLRYGETITYMGRPRPPDDPGRSGLIVPR